MNIKKIIKEEIDDFDWISDVPSGIQLKSGIAYIIDCCETGYSEEKFKEKIYTLFGNQKVNINWFDNPNIRAADVKHRCKLHLLFLGEPGDTFIESGEIGWVKCHSDFLEREYPRHKTITPEEFLNSWI